MPKKQTIERVSKDQRAGKAPSTQAGEFVREEIDIIRKGEHGARSTKQAIADEAGDRDRPFQSAPCRREAAAPKTRHGARGDAREGET